jgi:hypothetical protein
LKIEEQGNPSSLTVYAGVGYLTGFYRKLEIAVYRCVCMKYFSARVGRKVPKERHLRKEPGFFP